jgi:hypothetical protein
MELRETEPLLREIAEPRAGLAVSVARLLPLGVVKG